MPEDKAVKQLKEAATEGKLVAIMGTGVSLALTNSKVSALSWRGLIEDGFAFGQTKGRIKSEQYDRWKNQLASDDLDDLLGAAEFMCRKLDAPAGDLYARWLKNAFEHVKPENIQMANAVRALSSIGVPLCTLNYDTLLESITSFPSINLEEVQQVSAWMRREKQGVLHLHGSWDSPASCILGIRDYQTTVGNDVRDLIQRALGSFSRLLFIGCGGTFADPNFRALINWLRERIKSATPQHYALVIADEVPERHADPAWHGFVDPLSFGPSHRDLSRFLLKHFPLPKASKPVPKASLEKVGSAVLNSKVLAEYRAFLVKDCGQMTIEGVRADMDTAQRRFDLERLFVPLKVLPTPPDIPASDPKREAKLSAWHEKNKTPLPFGSVFQKNKHLALLALPGGGKSLLLKRLAVAYADPARREKSDDVLPILDLTPVLIRCREWREYIRRPILVLLQNIATITGQASLADLSAALIPLFLKGRILLLIDGLDEIHNDADRSIFVKHLEDFLDEYKLTRLVVTSREAGFSLVAPSLARFCERWRVAPLDEGAISTLCDHWHRLMKGGSREALSESREVASRLLESDSLRRLAENPLLLTMLLVVKHGAGRLPPDRVSLYERAVEVLLDTWNIQGHDPLNLKEAVPQIAYVAFQLMCQGKQTATEKELLGLLEEAREKVPQIRRYAKDSPDEFLKRIELRSSLVVEAGHQLEGTRAVPFYQFRHLTFQEYLAAVAAVEGHYKDYKKDHTVLNPLQPYLTAQEWKEVIPMAAVLAKKQAEPLLAALLSEVNSLRHLMESEKEFPGSSEWYENGDMPPPAARLLQCLVEEAEASPDTLTAVLQALALFSRASDDNNWWALARGPYGAELRHQAFLVYSAMKWPKQSWLRNTLAELYGDQYPSTFWQSTDGRNELLRLIVSDASEDVVRALLVIVILQWGNLDRSDYLPISVPVAEVERHLFHDDRAIRHAAAWSWGITYRRQVHLRPSPKALDRLLVLWLARDTAPNDRDIFAFAIAKALGRERALWTPLLTDQQKQLVRDESKRSLPDAEGYAFLAVLTIAFFARDVWTDKELAQLMSQESDGIHRDEDNTRMSAALKQLRPLRSKLRKGSL